MNKEHQKTLQKIQNRLYAKYAPRLFKTRPKADVILTVIDKALTEDRHRFDDDTLTRLQAIKDSRILEGEEKYEDPDVAQEYELEMEKEVGKAIMRGDLPPPNKKPELSKSSKNYGKRNTKSNTRSDRKPKGRGS